MVPANKEKKKEENKMEKGKQSKKFFYRQNGAK